MQQFLRNIIAKLAIKKYVCQSLIKISIFISIIFLLQICILNTTVAQIPPTINWQKCFGGSGDDFDFYFASTNDGGYIVTGITNSNDGDVAGVHGQYDIWVIKLNSSMNMEWQKCLGGSGDEYPYSIIQTKDNGYIIAGQTLSNDGDISGNHGGSEGWVVKLNSIGTIQWQKCLGGTGTDVVSSVIQLQDSKYIIAGVTSSNDGNVSGNHGSYDAWIIELDTNGSILWQKCLGGTGSDRANSIVQTMDKGFVFAGRTNSSDGIVSGFHGGMFDYWVVKIDSVGQFLWQKCLGGSGREDAYNVIQSNDGGYVIAGNTDSNDGDVSGFHGAQDGWVVKLNSSGTLIWQKCLGGGDNDFVNSTIETKDKGYIISGQIGSNGGDIIGDHGGGDCRIVKFDSSGALLWQQCYGGSGSEEVKMMIERNDSGYVLCSTTISNDGDVSGNHGA